MEGTDLEVPQADSPGAAYLWFVTTLTQTATQTTPQGNCPAVCYLSPAGETTGLRDQAGGEERLASGVREMVQPQSGPRKQE